MKIATLQSTLFWEDTLLNLQHFDIFLESLPNDVDVVVLPEMFTTGFTMSPQNCAVENGGEGLQWMLNKAAEINACIVGSIAVKEVGAYFNRLYWVFPTGTFKTYDKKHLFRMAHEDGVYKSGTERLIVDYKGWKFAPFVCYDLRFPVWCRNAVEKSDSKSLLYDCAVFVANWPAARANAWETLLQARAIENLSYVVGVNRVGVDANSNEYNGKSHVIDFKGAILDNHIDGAESISIVTLDKDALDGYRSSFPAYLDADAFTFDSYGN